MITKKQFKETRFEGDFHGKKLSFATGKLAPHCDGAVEITWGETKLLVTAVMQKHPSPDKDFFPLSIDFRESYYAAGKIGGGRFRKREGRPSDDSILYARLVDRPLRPVFPKGMINDVVVTISPLSLDQEHSPGELSIIGSSVAVMLAGIPFNGPVGAARIGYNDGKYIINPTETELQWALMDLHVAGTKDHINMIECGATEVPLDILKEGLRLAHEVIITSCKLQEEFLKLNTIKPLEITISYPSDEMMQLVKEQLPDSLIATLENVEKNDFEERLHQMSVMLETHFADKMADKGSGWTENLLWLATEKCIKQYMRNRIVKDGIRADGRWLEQVRQIYCETGLVERAHGTGLFRRGDSQALAILTLGSPGDAEMVDDMESDQEEKRFMHHYKMPPFSNNEAQMIRNTNRREIGHGRLAEKAIEAVIPAKEDFPYTIRLVSEVLGSGGSTSMASTCASTLALMDGWVPIKAPVSWIAMGLVSESEDNQVILTDIMGIEDYMIGDMDFKLAGTKEGVTAIQMDIKIHGIKVEKLIEIVDRANVGRLEILDFMLQTLDKPKAELSPYAPYILPFQVRPEQIREVIGKGGETIQEITRVHNVKIDIEDSWHGSITGKNKASADAAMQMISDIIRTPQRWDKIKGKVTRLEKYGIFVDLGRKKMGLAHVKNLGKGFIEDASTLYTLGEMVDVEILDIDQEGKIGLKVL